MTIEDFPAYAKVHWPEIRQSLLDGSYQPRPVRRVVVPKPQGKGERSLGVPCVVDRVIQQAILQILTPIFDPNFSESSYGSRPKRSAHGAINQVKGFIKAGYQYVVDSQYYTPVEELDKWLRRRIRMCYWKQWRKPRTRIGHLLKLGTSQRQAIRTGISRKGYWRLSKTLATHTGMTNEWLEEQGLLSIRKLWIKVQGYAS
jgi:RNA-directed DNA polymerase